MSEKTAPVPARRSAYRFALLLYAWGAFVGVAVCLGYGRLPQLCFTAAVWSVASASLFRYVDRPWAPWARRFCGLAAVLSAIAWFVTRASLGG